MRLPWPMQCAWLGLLASLIVIISPVCVVAHPGTAPDRDVGGQWASAPVLNNTDINGFNLNGAPTFHETSVQACAARCQGIPNCVAVSWNGPNSHYHDNNCNFKCAAPASAQTKDPGEEAIILQDGGNTCMKPPPAPQAAWQPPAWAPLIATANLLNSTQDDHSAQIGNGYMGFLVGQGTEYVAGLFNGKLSYTNHTTSHRASVPSPLTSVSVSAVNGVGPDPHVSPAALDLRTASYLSAYRDESSGATCQHRLYAHQSRAHLLVSELECSNPGTSTLNVSLQVSDVAQSGDLHIVNVPTPPGYVCYEGTILVTETTGATPSVIGMCTTDASSSPTLSVPAGHNGSLLLLSARYTNIDTDTPTPPTQPVSAALAELQSATAAGGAALWNDHTTAMSSRTDPGIYVSGNVDLARAINASLYALMCTVREDVLYSSSPGGLATDAYNGHSFWDVETWMWPTWLAFHPDVAKSVLQYRINRRAGAAANAAQHGFQGYMFPWESAFSGTEVDPAQGTTTEEHLQGDIAFAFTQYYSSTHNDTWLQQGGYDVIEGIATFWASKAVLTPNGTYSIPHIMGPDEYHGDVTDSVYCNVVAAVSLRAAYNLAPVVGKTPNQTLLSIADKLTILYDPTNHYHPEFEGYTRGTKVKQADTILLGYPLNFPMTSTLHASDLDYYATVTDPNGPAMTWSMFAVGYGDIGNTDKAASYFGRGYQYNSLGAYHDWHEVVGASGADNFITGAGGFMQSVWAGYGGARYVNSTLRLQQPRPPPNCTSMTLHGVSFRGVRLVVVAEANGWSVALATESTKRSSSPQGKVGASDTVAAQLQVQADGSTDASPLSTTPVHFAAGVSATVSEKTTV